MVWKQKGIERMPSIRTDSGTMRHDEAPDRSLLIKLIIEQLFKLVYNMETSTYRTIVPQTWYKVWIVSEDLTPHENLENLFEEDYNRYFQDFFDFLKEQVEINELLGETLKERLLQSIQSMGDTIKSGEFDRDILSFAAWLGAQLGEIDIAHFESKCNNFSMLLLLYELSWIE